MTSQIDTTVPVYGSPTTESVRANFTTASVEISALQDATAGGPFLPLAGAHMTGPMYLYNDPTDVMMPATKGYVDSHPAGSGGTGGVPEAPADGQTYGRDSGTWVPVLPLSGGTLTGELILAADPTAALDAATKQYVDGHVSLGSTAVQRAGDTMTGLLVLSGDPTAPLGAATRQYVDNGLAPKAPTASPTFTGTVTNTGGRTIISAASGPTMTLIDTTASRPIFGISNNNSILGFGLMTSAGNPSGANLLGLDQVGNLSAVGNLSSTKGRIISSGNNFPAVIASNSASGGVTMGLWAGIGSLCFGTADAGGNPVTQLALLNTSGDITAGRNLIVGNGCWVEGSSTDGATHIMIGISTDNQMYIGDGVRGITVQGVTTHSAALVLNNNVFLEGKDTGGTQRVLIGMGNDNNVYISNTNNIITQALLRVGAGQLPFSDNGFSSGLSGTAWSQVASYWFNTVSGRDVKDDIEPLVDGALDKVLALRPVNFYWKEEGSLDGKRRFERKRHHGFIADEVAEVLGADFGGYTKDNDSGAEGISYNELVSVLWKATQEIAHRLAAIEGKR